jgi:anti-sigma factor RsiW
MNPFWQKLRFRRDHRWTPPHMSAYLDSEQSASARLRLERHTGECPECRAVLDDLERMLALLQGATLPGPVLDVPAIAGAVLRRLHEPAGD